MNSLYYFWNEYPVEQALLRKEEYIRTHPNVNPDEVIIPIEYTLSPGQADLFEGTVGTSGLYNIDKTFDGHILTDAVLRSVGYKYCNVLCLYKLDYNQNQTFVQYGIPNMKGFGDYVVIIENECEFLNRIERAVNKANFKFLCGNVHYHDMKKDGKLSEVYERNHIVLKMDREADMEEFELRAQRDCFSKMDKFKDQCEWRVALYRGVKETNAYTLNIGAIEDIARYVKVENLTKEIDKLFSERKIQPSGMGYYGNIGRKEMKNLLYELGNNKVEVFTCIG